MLNGVTELIMMKADVMDSFDTLKVAVGYEVNGKRQDSVPYDTYAEVTPVYKEFKGWKRSLSNIQDYNELPAEFKEYISFIEHETGVPVTVISLGPDRAETVFRK